MADKSFEELLADLKNAKPAADSSNAHGISKQQANDLTNLSMRFQREIIDVFDKMQKDVADKYSDDDDIDRKIIAALASGVTTMNAMIAQHLGMPVEVFMMVNKLAYSHFENKN